jgi:hypothetical protein
MGSASQSRIACGLTLASWLAEMSTLPIALKFRHVGTSTMPTKCWFLLSLRLQSSSVSRLFTLWFKNPPENEYFFPDSDFHPLETAMSRGKISLCLPEYDLTIHPQEIAKSRFI